jgi:hypothetical protein
MSTLFAADSDLQVLALLASVRDSHFYELANTLDIQHLKRVVLQYPRVVVHGEELVLGIFT